MDAVKATIELTLLVFHIGLLFAFDGENAVRGLEKVFRAMLQAPCWEGPLLQAFKHFLVKHIEFDSDPNAGHGALCRHLTPDDRVLPFWTAFESMLLEAVPRLVRGS